MKKDYSHILTLSDLQAEQYRLKAQYLQKGETLKESAGLYVKQFSPVYLFKKYFTKDNFSKLDSQTNISGKIMSVLLPLILNKTLFKGSGFITKTLVGLATNKLGGKLDLDHLGGLVDKVKGLFGKRKEKRERVIDYGIPEDSETY